MQIAKAVKALRKDKRAANVPAVVTSGSLNQGPEKLVADVVSIVNLPERHAEAMVFIERAHSRFELLAREIRQPTTVVG
jgi:hypothetical protein